MPPASAPSRSSVHDTSERRGRRGRGAKEFSCETCGKVYRHPNCLVKHRWEHNPYWTEASQFLLSKHQQVQLMEAAAILTHGRSLPTDRALWPSYMSGGILPSPTIAGDGTPQDEQDMLSDSGSLQAHEERDQEEEQEEQEQEQDQEQADNTDESDVPPPAAHSYSARARLSASASASASSAVSTAHRRTAPVDIHPLSLGGPARTTYDSRSSIGYSPYRSPRGLNSPPPRWGVIGELVPHHTPHLATSPPTGHRGYLDQLSAHRTTPTAAAGKPVAIPTPHPHPPYSGPQSFSSFGSIAQSFGSSSTSSHIPSSSIRSVEADDEDDYEGAYAPHYQHVAPLATNQGMKWSPPRPAPRTVYEDVDELDMDMD